MPDVRTSCSVCGAAYETKRGLAVHLTRSGHGARAKAQAIVQALAGTKARPIPCTHPGCVYKARTTRGLAIHRRLMGHTRTQDSVEHGDGPRPEPTHPAHRPQHFPADRTVAFASLAMEPSGPGLMDDHAQLVDEAHGSGRRIHHPGLKGLRTYVVPIATVPATQPTGTQQLNDGETSDAPV